MGAYTQSIREILQFNKTPQQKLTDVNDVYDLASQYLFDEMPQNVISDDYAKQFITGFTLHFMNEELGLETLPLWKIALNEKIYNSGTYINKIFENLDKEIFANYQVKNVENEGTTSGEKLGTGTISNEREDNRTTTTSDDVTYGGTVNTTIDDTLRGTGTVTNAKTGSDTLARTGTDTAAKTGTDTLEQTGTNANAHTGTQGTTGSNEQDTDNTGTTSNDHNVIQINSDTPMGSLANLRTPGGNAKGTGVGYANGQTYNYMSSASEVDESNVQTDNTNQHTEGTDSSTTTFNDTVTETRNLTDETTYDSTNTRTLNLSDAQTYGSSNTETRNTTDTTDRSESVVKGGTDSRDISSSVEGKVTDTETRNTSDVETGTHADSTDEIDYSLNWEMLYKSMPLLNKVWEIFDDLFMLIF